MSIRAPEILPGAIVGHRASQTVCRVQHASPAGYTGWLYRAAQVAAPAIVHTTTADGLVPMTRHPSRPDAQPAASPAGEAATAKGVSPCPMRSPPSGGPA